MYVSFLGEIPESYHIAKPKNIVTDIYLETKEEMDNVYEFIEKFGLGEFKKLFDIVKIKYTSIEYGGSAYRIENGKLLHLYDLSSGERILLYALVMSQLKKPFLIVGLTDRLDKEHRDILINLSDLLSTTVILVNECTGMNQDIVNNFYISFNELIERGVV